MRKRIKKMYVAAVMVACLSDIDCHAAGGVVKAGVVRINSSYTTPNHNYAYCRTCRHRPNGSFRVDVVSLPVLEKEWRFVSVKPDCEWGGAPSAASVSDDGVLNVSLAEKDFPRAYVMSLTATWHITNGKKTAKTSARATMGFDAIDYEIRVASPLVDSEPDVCTVNANGCTRPGLLDLELTSSPTAEACQNEVNSFDMGFKRVAGTLAWDIEHPYWYGGAEPPKCCYVNMAEYEYRLVVDGCDKHTQSVRVQLPANDLSSYAK